MREGARKAQKVLKMKICVVGAGSIGGLLGVKLALAGHDVTLIARGANLAAIGKHDGGWAVPWLNSAV